MSNSICINRTSDPTPNFTAFRAWRSHVMVYRFPNVRTTEFGTTCFVVFNIDSATRISISQSLRGTGVGLADNGPIYKLRIFDTPLSITAFLSGDTLGDEGFLSRWPEHLLRYRLASLFPRFSGEHKKSFITLICIHAITSGCSTMLRLCTENGPSTTPPNWPYSNS